MLELFDLKRLVDTLPSDHEIAGLQPMIHAAISMSSVWNDLKRANEMMVACKTLSGSIRVGTNRGERPRRDQAATVQALFAQAVLLYTRATHSKAKGRNKLQITAHFDHEQRALHDRITDLRDRYLAHFEDASGWEEHRAVLALDIEDAKMALSYPHASAYIQVPDAVDFERLLGIALPISHDQFRKVSLKLNLVVNELFDTRPDFLKQLREARFDPASFFDADEIQPYLDGIGRLDPDAPTEPRIGDVRPSAVDDISTNETQI